MAGPGPEPGAARIRRLKEAVPIEEVIGGYYTLIPEGTRYLRAVEHDSLVVDRARGRYHWNARGESGDVLDFLRRQEGLSLPQAVARLGERAGEGARIPNPPRAATPSRSPPGGRGPARHPAREVVAALGVAVATYHAALLAADRPRAYLARRGIDAGVIRQLHLGWCSGGRLAPALEQAGVPPAWARDAGLLVARPEDGEDLPHPTEDPGPDREFLAGRVVVPEIGDDGPTWLIGRTLPGGIGPRYLGLPRPKPLLGYHRARAGPVVLVTEGVFDALTLLAWGLPGVATCGIDLGPLALAQLRTLAATRRVYLLPQADAAGRRAALRLAALLPPSPPILPLPAGVKDVGELAERADGRAAFLATLPADVRRLLRPAPRPGPG